MDENLFSQTYAQIVGKVLNKDNFQMLAAPIDFSFPVAPAGQIAPQAYQIVSRMPVWSPVGSFNAGDTPVADAYRQVLTHVTFVLTPAQQNDYNKLQDQVTQASNDVTTAVSNMNQAYLVQKQNGGVIFQAQYPDVTKWLAGPGAVYQKDVDNKKAAFNALTDKLFEVQQGAMTSSLGDATKIMKEPTADVASSPAPRGWVKVPDGSGVLRWQPEWSIGTTGQAWRAQLASGSMGAFTIQIDASDHSSDLSKSWAGGNVSIDQPFWAVNVGGNWEKLDLATGDQSIKATVSVESSTLVSVRPGDWYDGGFMRQLLTAGSSGPGGFSISPGWNATGAPPALFGRQGILPTMVSGLFVVYKPSFSITMSSSTLQQNQQKLDASAGVRIGPFTFGGQGGHQSDFQHSTSNGNTFSGQSTSEDPLIIGVTVAFPPNDTASA